jgi:hypothetical protein
MNLMYDTFSNIYFLLHVYSKVMKLIHKVTFSLQTCFLVQGPAAFRIIHLRKFDRTLLYTVKRWVFFYKLL